MPDNNHYFDQIRKQTGDVTESPSTAENSLNENLLDKEGISQRFQNEFQE